MDQKQHRISLKCLQQFLDLPAWQTQTDPRLQPFFSPFADSPHIPSRTIILFRFSLFTLLVILILIVLPLLLLSIKGSVEIHIWYNLLFAFFISWLHHWLYRYFSLSALLVILIVILYCSWILLLLLNRILTPWGPLKAPWGLLRAPEASKTCLPYSPLNVDMIWYAFLHTLDLNGIFTPWGPPEGPLRAPWAPPRAQTSFFSQKLGS